MKPTEAVAVALLFASACLGVSQMQPKLARTIHETTSREDVYVLPPPDQLKRMSLGYHAATVDMLWAKLLVEYGIHHHEKRVFPDLEKYLDAILALEPDYAPVFKYVDTLLVYRPPRGYEDDARTARKIHERGIEARPHDRDVWQGYGEFLAFVAPSFLTSETEIAQWRKDGAIALEKAVSLGADSTRAVTAASLLSAAGEREAAIRQWKNAYAMTDDEAEREKFLARLQALQSSKEQEEIQRAVKLVEGQWKRELPFLSRGTFLLLGPITDPAYCVGPASSDEKARCPRDWDELIVPRN